MFLEHYYVGQMKILHYYKRLFAIRKSYCDSYCLSTECLFVLHVLLRSKIGMDVIFSIVFLTSQ